VELHKALNAQEFHHKLDEFYFTTAEKKILENCGCIVPNFMNDYCNSFKQKARALPPAHTIYRTLTTFNFPKLWKPLPSLGGYKNVPKIVCRRD
jgi:hypothetical protein